VGGFYVGACLFVAYLGFVEEFDGDADCGGEFAHGGLGF
jgi:hypothetical protein